ncbi:PRA1 domain-containing protein [Cephalotus follicularis]|uniref:PRA1 family protein n=1 Tax=Cephalotus follicularis TaxID=3775 RepID=A0A1Q3AXZ2_CEPFO|nr:PRA1 domain-containing protein [Cephalotus follicularis]
MTTYGTIPTSSSAVPSSKLEYISRAKERIKAGLGSRRPWRVMLDIHSIKLPSNFHEAVTRVRTNIAYFRMNYAMIVLFIIFLSLLWHPISLIVFIVMMATWLFLYFLRDEPLMVFSRTIDDRVVLIVLSVLTIVFLLLTDVTLNIVVSLLVGLVVVVGLHAAFRKTDDLFLDEEATGLMTGVAATPSSSST